MHDSSVSFLADRIFVFEGTPTPLRRTGPYKTEAFFASETPYSTVMEAEDWLNAQGIHHQTEIETQNKEQGLVLRIFFPSDKDRRRFVADFEQR